jgi:hypothetical protein
VRRFVTLALTLLLIGCSKGKTTAPVATPPHTPPRFTFKWGTLGSIVGQLRDPDGITMGTGATSISRTRETTAFRSSSTASRRLRAGAAPAGRQGRSESRAAMPAPAPRNRAA